MKDGFKKRLMALWLMSPLIGVMFAGTAYLLFLFRDRFIFMMIPFVSFAIGSILLMESKWEMEREKREDD
jgi:phosphate/sulfate permease